MQRRDLLKLFAVAPLALVEVERPSEGPQPTLAKEVVLDWTVNSDELAGIPGVGEPWPGIKSHRLVDAKAKPLGGDRWRIIATWRRK